MLERLFQLKAHNTNVRTEILAGFTTFLAMAYILFVNPSILGETGMDKGAVFVATCLAAAIGSTVMGLIANYPIALAPGMGLNAFFTYTVVLHMGHTWQVALGAVFISAVLFFLLSIFRIREWIINSIPLPLRSAIAAGIGLFLALIALHNAGIVVSNPATMVGLGDLKQPAPILATLGFALIVALEALKVRGAVLIGILAVTIASIVMGFTPFGGVMSMPPSLAPTFLQLDIKGALDIGTLIGVAKRAGLMGKDGHMPKMGRALIADSTAAMAGSLLGTSTTTSYIESAAGVSAGGRTGLTAVVVAILFLLALFFSPLAASVPPFATAPALLFVAVLMTSGLAEIDWDDITVAAPVVVTALAMPFTYSIANGIAFGFISWTAIKLLSGRGRELNPALVILSILFVIKLGWFNA
jgi:AGZA family xanthine/uracil permease-like MFS transporter